MMYTKVTSFFLVFYLSIWIQAQTLEQKTIPLEWQQKLEQEDASLVQILYSAGDEIVPLAKKAIAAKNERLRGAAVYVLGKFKVVESLPEIMGMLKDTSWQVRCAALSSLSNFVQPETRTRIMESLEDPNWQVRYMAIRQLGKLQYHPSLSLLHKLLAKSEDTEEVLAAVCDALAEIGHRDSLPILWNAISHKYEKVRLACDNALTKIAQYHFSSFMDKLKDRHENIECRRTAAMIAGRLKAKSALPLVYSLAKDTKEEAEIRYICLILIADMDPENGLSLFWDCLKDSNPVIQRGAVLALGKQRKVEALPQFFTLLETGNGTLRETCLWAISQIDIRDSKPMILKGLAHQNPSVVQGAIRLIGSLEITEAVPILIAMSHQNRQDQEVGRHIGWALETLCPLLPSEDPQKKIIPQILEDLKKMPEIK